MIPEVKADLKVRQAKASSADAERDLEVPDPEEQAAEVAIAKACVSRRSGRDGT